MTEAQTEAALTAIAEALGVDREAADAFERYRANTALIDRLTDGVSNPITAPADVDMVPGLVVTIPSNRGSAHDHPAE